MVRRGREPPGRRFILRLPPEPLGEGLEWRIGWRRIQVPTDDAEAPPIFVYRSPGGYRFHTVAMARHFIRTQLALGDDEDVAYETTRVLSLTMLRRFIQALAENGGDEESAFEATRRSRQG
jgi:hypothetical protein